MPKAKIDQLLVSTAVCDLGRRKVDIYDPYIAGFVLEVRANGGMTYYLRYRGPDGRLRQKKIGGVMDISVADARKEAQRLRSLVVLGGDPLAEKRAVKAVPTYREIAAVHLRYAKHQRSYSSTEGVIRVHLNPEWGNVRVNQMTRQGVMDWLEKKRKSGLSPATVEKLRVVLGRSFELARQEGLPGCENNPARGHPRRPLNNARERFLSPEEGERLRMAAAQSMNTQLLPIVQLLLLTGARKRELLDAKWEHVSLERKVWLIPTSKTGKSRHLPLSAPAVRVIEGLRRFKNCPWLLPNPETLKPFVSIKNSFQVATKVAKLPGLRIHDLRHSAASYMINGGVDLFAVGKILGHASYQSTQRYSHLAMDTLRAAVEAGAAKQDAA